MKKYDQRLLSRPTASSFPSPLRTSQSNPLTINLTKQRLTHKRALHHRSVPDAGSVRGLGGSDVGRGMRDEAHGDEDDEEVEPDGAVLGLAGGSG